MNKVMNQLSFIFPNKIKVSIISDDSCETANYFNIKITPPELPTYHHICYSPAALIQKLLELSVEEQS